MSTRGCVAIPDGRGWKGVFNHWDSYATELGKDLWDYLQKRMKAGTLGDFTKDLLEATRWEVLVNKDNSFGEKYEKEKDALMTNKDADALFIEWVYVVDVVKRQVEIYNHFNTGKIKWYKRDDGTKYNSPLYDWVRTRIVKLDEPEPDWEKLEKQCFAIAEGFYVDKT